MPFCYRFSCANKLFDNKICKYISVFLVFYINLIREGNNKPLFSSIFEIKKTITKNLALFLILICYGSGYYNGCIKYFSHFGFSSNFSIKILASDKL